jgi:phosphatidylinositol 4-kinase A
MFHLRASSEEQKSVWKYKLRKVINASALPEDLPESQKERYERYQNAKWFGRTLTEVTNELDNSSFSERSQALQDAFFELEIPRNVIWPWRKEDESSEKSVFVVLPHFSHLISSKEKRRSFQPRFQASFMLKRDEASVTSRYETFIQEGQQKGAPNTLVLPDSIRFTLEAARLLSDYTILAYKDNETGSTTGASTDDVSVADSNISGYNSTVSEPDDTDNDQNQSNLKHIVKDVDCEDSSVASDPGQDTSFEISACVPVNRHISELTIDLPHDVRFQRDAAPSFSQTTEGLGNEELEEKEQEEQEQEQAQEFKGGDELDDRIPNLSVELVLKGTPVKKKEDGKIDESQTSDNNSKVEGEDASLAEPSSSIPEGTTRREALQKVNRSSSFFDNQENDSDSAKDKELVSLRTKPYRVEEILATQLAQHYESFFAPSMIWVRAPRLRRVSKDMAISEVERKHAITVAAAKATVEEGDSLLDYFFERYGSPESETFQRAQTCFAQSLAGLSLITYLLGIKNRHDGNLMLDREGHIFASDYSCALGSDAPAFGSSIEIAPFKLTTDYLNIMGGPKGTCYQFFRCLVVAGLKRAREDAATAIGLLRLVPGNQNCQKKIDRAARYLNQKLMLDATDEVAENKMRLVIEHSQQHLSTSAFDALTQSMRSTAVGV